MASVRVAVRVRPMNRREKDLDAKFIIQMQGNKTSITNIKIPEGISGDSARERIKTFTYDFSYDSADNKHANYASQEKVFKDLGSDVLKAAFEGYNACIFAYGQTGSGKSYTMMGNPGDQGLIPRICEGLFSRIAGMTRWDEASFRTEVSYLEIYNERVRDLLRRKSTKTYNLRVREHPKDGPYVEDLSKHLVQNYSDVEELMEAGNINRTTASTGMNDVSSRSHAIFTINFTQAKFDAEMPCETVSKIHLVDLAGSERADATGATGVRLKEGGNINKSLVTLGNVISALADLSQEAVSSHVKKKQVFVPYRDSVLTWLLKDSLGGNSKTIMIATVSPADVNYGETLSTLRYANRAKNIINKPTINEDSNVKLIRELRAEIARLKALLAQGNQIALLDSPTALSMEEKLHQNEARVIELTKEWTNKWNETQNILKEETLALRKEGIGVVLDSELPHLIGIDDDLLSTGIILYHLKEGRTYVGRDDAATEQDIVLHGLDLESEHCVFENLNGTVTLIPLNGAQCSVNGVQIMEPIQLNQGAVILLGRTNMFRFNHPKEAAKLREKRKSGLLSSFSLSMTDLSKSCENLSAVMLYNPGLEFERQQREELEKLENKRKLIKEMEEKQKCEKAELERMQQEVESQRKESEQVQLRIRKQEESLKRRSQDIESRLKDLLAEKERFEEERLREQQEMELQKKKQEEEIHIRVQKEQERLQEIHQKEKAEKMEIFRELEKLKRERDEQSIKMELEKRRLEKQEQEQLSLVFRLEEQLREKQEMIRLLKRDDVQRVEEEKRILEEIRGVLLKAKEARPDGDEEHDDVKNAKQRYMSFKMKQLEQLQLLEQRLLQQKDHLEKDISSERKALGHLLRVHEEHQKVLRETQEKGTLDATNVAQEKERIKQAEQRLQYKERQLHCLTENHLPTITEEKQRSAEIVEKGLPGLDNTLYQIEKEIEEKAEQLALYCASADQLQQLQETYEFTANVARQEEKVRRKEKEILESKEKQQREALEQAVAKLERRHSALQRQSTIELEIEEQKRKLASLHHSEEQVGLQASLEAEHKALEQDRERLEREIQQLKQKICENDGALRSLYTGSDEKSSHSSSPVSPKQSLPTLIPVVDDRINAYIEEEVQRRLQKLNQTNGDNNIELSLSTETLKEEEQSSNDGSSLKLTDEEDEKSHNGVDPRKQKYETTTTPRHSIPSLLGMDAAFLRACEKRPRSEEQKGICCLNELHWPYDWGYGNDMEKGHIAREKKTATKQTAEEWDLLPHKSTPDKMPVELQAELKLHQDNYDWREIGVQQWKYASIFAGSDGNSNNLCHTESRQTNKSTDLLAVLRHRCSESEPGGTLLDYLTNPHLANTEPEQEQTNRPLLPGANIQSEVPVQEYTASTEVPKEDQFGHSVISQVSYENEMGLEQKFSKTDIVSEELETEQNSGLGYFISKLSCIYKDASRCLQSTQEVVRQVRKGDFQCRSSWYGQMYSVIKDLPFVHKVHLEVTLKPDISPKPACILDSPKIHLYNMSEPSNITPSENVTGYLGTPVTSVMAIKCENLSVLCQRLVQYPRDLCKLQTLPLQNLLACLDCVLPHPAGTHKQLRGIYWLAVANCKQPVPQPGLVLLYDSVMFALTSNTNLENNNSNILKIFHRLPLELIKEVHIGFAGQNLRVLGHSEDTILTICTYNKHLSQEVCQALLRVLLRKADDANYKSHPLLWGDLMQLSINWEYEITDLTLTGGFRVSSKFKKVLADLLYVLHGNMLKNKPSLGNVNILLYTTVIAEVKSHAHHTPLTQFVLTNTHIGLLQEDSVFYPIPGSIVILPKRAQFDQILLMCRSDLRCVLVADKESSTKLELVFANSEGSHSEQKDHEDSSVLVPSHSCGNLSRPAEVWKLTFGTSEEAGFLINSLSAV
ncbi:kinesin-like protein KIF16B isoform X2 [Lepisosteus oculatus]|uniref:kinesin-like protein KIF16B isoform X2 n=1 Tax=Lepisosteus oculatus TaxID=7918 RepID=UPI00073FE594|nr:PREDICTED: kinesin-like protein KIF16B isoform X2 [Lepisosteus oculatus]